jgi:hypothetical protein
MARRKRWEIEDLIEMSWAGATLKEMGRRARLSSERVRELILRKWQGHPPRPGRRAPYRGYYRPGHLNVMLGYNVNYYDRRDRPTRGLASLDVACGRRVT